MVQLFLTQHESLSKDINDSFDGSYIECARFRINKCLRSKWNKYGFLTGSLDEMKNDNNKLDFELIN